MAVNIKITVLGDVSPCSLSGRLFHDSWSIRDELLFSGKLMPSSSWQKTTRIHNFTSLILLQHTILVNVMLTVSGYMSNSFSMFRKSLINCKTVAYARLHCVTSQEIPLFIGKAMRAQNLA